MKPYFCIVLSAILTLFSCSKNENSQAILEISADAENPQPIVVYYSPYNGSEEQQKVEVVPDSTGHALLSIETPEDVDSFNATVVIDGHNHANVLLEKGESLKMNIALLDDGKVSIKYEGKNAVASEFLDAMGKNMNLMEFFECDTLLTSKEILARLDDRRSLYKPMIDAMADERQRDYFSRYLDRSIDKQKTIFIELQSRKGNSNCDTVKEYADIIESIDPNDEIDNLTGLAPIWYERHLSENENSEFTKRLESKLEHIDRVVTNPKSRRIAVNSVVAEFFSHVLPPKKDLAQFKNLTSSYASGYPELVDKVNARIGELEEVVLNGEKLPFDVVMETPEGNKVNLSQLYGKVLYVDLWATWCGPCCGEIPYMAKLYEHYRNNPKIELVSISIDDSREAWLDKLKKDNPGWLQFNIGQDERKQFVKALDISGIPRFMVISADGTFVNTFAMRPSENGIIEYLDKVIAGS